MLVVIRGPQRPGGPGIRARPRRWHLSVPLVYLAPSGCPLGARARPQLPAPTQSLLTEREATARQLLGTYLEGALPNHVSLCGAPTGRRCFALTVEVGPGCPPSVGTSKNHSLPSYMSVTPPGLSVPGPSQHGRRLLWSHCLPHGEATVSQSPGFTLHRMGSTATRDRARGLTTLWSLCR